MLFLDFPMMRLTALVSAMALLVLQSGCAASPRTRPSLDLHAKLRSQKVALVSLPAAIDAAPEFFARGRVAGALKGAAVGSLHGLAGIRPGSCQGEMCGAVLIIWAALAATVGMTVGAVQGAIQATPAAEADRLERDVKAAIALASTHLDLSGRILAAAGDIPGLQLRQLVQGDSLLTVPPDYHTFRGSEYGSVLEVAVTGIHLQTSPESGSLARLEMVSTARVVDGPTGAVLFGETFHHLTPYTEWSQAQGDDVLRVLDEGINETARSIVATVFESVDLPLPRNEWAFPGSSSFGWCWLTPVTPPRDYQFWGAKLRTPPVDTVQPTLSWQPFPTPEQAESLHKATGRTIDGVTYDLRLWKPHPQSIPTMVYERQHLAQPSHEIELPLQRCSEYYWSMRACFPWDGVTICTPWAFSAVPAATASSTCDVPVIPLANYYRFRTPC